MQVTLTNLTSSPLALGDLGSKSLGPNESITIERSAGDLSRMKTVIREVAADKLLVSAVPSAAELASGLLASPQAVQAEDLAPVQSTDKAAVLGTWRVPMVAGAGGSADDVTGYAVNTLPFKVRVVRVWGRIATNVSGANVQARTAAAGGGTNLGQLDANTVGTKDDQTVNASVVVTPGALVGLFARRSDSGVAGELFIEWRREP